MASQIKETDDAPSSAKLSKSTRPQSAKTGTSTAKADNCAKHYMIYYLIGDVYLRPVAYVTGFLSKRTRGQPYPLRRSSGHLQLLPYTPTQPPPYSLGPVHPMSADLEYVTGAGVAPSSQPPQQLLLTVHDDARLAVLGELTGGFLFEGPSTVQLSGALHLAHYQRDTTGEEIGLREQALQAPGLSVKVQLLSGTGKLYVCDGQHLVLIYDADSHYVVSLVDGDGKGEEGGKAEAAALIKRITASQPVRPPQPLPS